MANSTDMNTPPGWQAAVIRRFGREEVAAETGPGVLTDGQQLEGEAARPNAESYRQQECRIRRAESMQKQRIRSGPTKGRTRQELVLDLPDMRSKRQLSVLPGARGGHFVVPMRKRDLLRVFGHGRGFGPAQSAELLTVYFCRRISTR